MTEEERTEFDAKDATILAQQAQIDRLSAQVSDLMNKLSEANTAHQKTVSDLQNLRNGLLALIRGA